MTRRYFVDRSLGKFVVPERLAVGGMLVEPYHKHFERDDEPDEVWIEFAATKGWAALTKDSDIRFNELERGAVVRHRMHLFTLVNGNLGGSQGADAFLAAAAKIEQACDRWAGKPLFGRVHSNGALDLIDPTLPLRYPGRRERGQGGKFRKNDEQ